MKTVWMVTDGCYSDYRVCGIYSSEAKAEKAKEFYRADNIEEIELDQYLNLFDKGFGYYTTYIKRDGRIRNEPTHYYPTYDGENGSLHIVKPYKSYGGFRNSTLITRGWYKTAKQAVKAANEKRAALIASGEWEPDPKGCID
jgi:hypothetical protein